MHLISLEVQGELQCTFLYIASVFVILTTHQFLFSGENRRSRSRRASDHSTENFIIYNHRLGGRGGRLSCNPNNYAAEFAPGRYNVKHSQEAGEMQRTRLGSDKVTFESRKLRPRLLLAFKVPFMCA